MTNLSAMHESPASHTPSPSYTETLPGSDTEEENTDEDKEEGDAIENQTSSPCIMTNLTPNEQLRIAIAEDNFALATTAIVNHADVNGEAYEDTTYLEHALLHECSPIIFELLLDNNADPDKKDTNNRTALHSAAFFANPDHLEILLTRSTKGINATDDDGDTALHLATCAPNGVGRVLKLETAQICKIGVIVSLLINAKADLFAQNNEGKTPLDQCNLYPLLCQIMWQARAEQKEQEEQEKLDTEENELS